MANRRAGLLGALALVAGAAVTWFAVGGVTGAGAGDLPSSGPGNRYNPVIEREDFTPRVTNAWFPLTPGTTLVYEGTKDGKAARNLFAITDQTKVVDGVRCRVVFDRLFLDGKLAERTYDYYAQDDDGNVWYFGEETLSLDENGNLTDPEGSFRAGTRGAKPGVFMPADPPIGRTFRQEWYRGHAEDEFKAVSHTARVTVPYGTFTGAMRTEEWTDLEPDVLDNKYYARGIGEVVETSVKGPLEKLELVAITKS